MNKPVKIFEEIHDIANIVQHSKFSVSDITDWSMELRENSLAMEKYNMDVKEKKLKDTEKTEAQQTKDRTQEILEKQKSIDDHKRQLEEDRIKLEENGRHRENEKIEHRYTLKDKKLEVKEKEENPSFTHKNDQSINTDRKKTFLIMKEIEKREKEVNLLQKMLDEREHQLEEKTSMVHNMNSFYKISHAKQIVGGEQLCDQTKAKWSSFRDQPTRFQQEKQRREATYSPTLRTRCPINVESKDIPYGYEFQRNMFFPTLDNRSRINEIPKSAPLGRKAQGRVYSPLPTTRRSITDHPECFVWRNGGQQKHEKGVFKTMSIPIKTLSQRSLDQKSSEW